MKYPRVATGTLKTANITLDGLQQRASSRVGIRHIALRAHPSLCCGSRTSGIDYAIYPHVSYGAFSLSGNKIRQMILIPPMQGATLARGRHRRSRSVLALSSSRVHRYGKYCLHVSQSLIPRGRSISFQKLARVKWSAGSSFRAQLVIVADDLSEWPLRDTHR